MLKDGAAQGRFLEVTTDIQIFDGFLENADVVSSKFFVYAFLL